METLGWLLIPLAATLFGILWMVWRGRERKPVDAEQGMEHMARFREAMEKPLPPLQRRPADGDDPAADESGYRS
jgi:hypothetical protein